MSFNRRKFLSLVSLSGLGVGVLHHQAQSQDPIQDQLDSRTQITDSAPSHLRFVAVGDVGTGKRSQFKVAQSMMEYCKQHPFSLALLVGDNIYNSGEIHRVKSVFDKPYNALLQNGVTFHAVLGNHDIRSNQGEDQLCYSGYNMLGRYYTFEDEFAQFFALDTNPGYHWPAQLEWLEQTLSRSQAAWKIVLGHHNIYSSGWHGALQNFIEAWGPLMGHVPSHPMLLKQLPQLFAQYGVQLYVNGHEHHYERTRPINGTTYLTCGIGGAKLRPCHPSPWTAFATSQFGFAAIDVCKDKLNIQGIDVDGNCFDQGTVLREETPQPDPISQVPIP
ncbi:metallophosphoesterase [Acaryochloris marina NIES-2412]|uniref:metallophosphoesterase n=1 Tax=Acaryochloris marina TaxID=155978 RepID=UPI0040591063